MSLSAMVTFTLRLPLRVGAGPHIPVRALAASVSAARPSRFRRSQVYVPSPPEVEGKSVGVFVSIGESVGFKPTTSKAAGLKPVVVY